MRTQEEITARIRAIESKDLFGFAREVLLSALEFEHVKPFLKEGTTAEQWGVPPHADDSSVTEAARQYLAFAWGKAEDHRGLSADRSVVKLTEYFWLLGKEDALQRMDAAGYAQYGAPILKICAEALGTPIPTSPALVRMMAGEACVPGCEQGCG